MITLLLILVLLSSFPIGYLLAYLCRDELVQGRKWFILLGVIALAASLVMAFLSIDKAIKFSIILALFYIAIVSFISCYKSYAKKFVRQKSKLYNLFNI